MLFNKLLLTTCVVVISFSAWCQKGHDHEGPCTYTFSGRVIDEETGETVPSANVLLKELNYTVVSDDSGRYEFKNLCKGEYTVYVTAVSFHHEEMKIQLHDHLVRDWLLENSVIKQQYTVRATSGVIVRMWSPHSELFGRELYKTRGLSLGESLRKLPAVNAVQTGPTISKPMIQGMYGNRVVVMNNGVRQEDQQWGNEHAPAVDPFVASRIRVIRGSQVLRYSSDAIGGIVFVDPPAFRNEPGWNGEFNAAGFSNNRMGAASAMFEYAPAFVPGLALRVQGSARRGGNSKAPDYYLANTAFAEYNFTGSAGYTKEDFSSEIYYSQFNTKVGIFSGSHIGNLTDLERAIQSDTPLVHSGFTYKIAAPYQNIQHELIKAKINYHWHFIGRLYLEVARQYNRRQEFDAHRIYNNNENTPALQFEITTYTENVGIERVRIGPTYLQVGTSFIQQKNTYEGRFFIPNFRSYNSAVFVTDQIVRSRWQMDAGIRYDYKYLQAFMWQNNAVVSPEFNFHNFTGAGAFYYSFFRQLSARINASTAFRPPAVNELFSNGLHHGSASVEVGDSTMVPEYAYNAAISFDYKSRNEKFAAVISGYYNHIQDYIYLAPVLPATLTIRGAFPTFHYRQTDARFTGMDVTLSDSITRKLWYNTRFSYVSAYNLSQKEYLVMIPPMRWENSLSWFFKSKNSWLNPYVSASVQWVAKQNRVPENSDYAEPPPGYCLLSAEAGVSLKMKEQVLDITLTAGNLLNTSYRDYLDRFRYFTDATGRNIMLRVRIPFASKTRPVTGQEKVIILH